MTATPPKPGWYDTTSGKGYWTGRKWASFGPTPKEARERQRTLQGLAIASLVLGVVGFVLTAVPIIGWLFGVVDLLAVILGAISTSQHNSRLGWRMGCAGVLLGIIPLALIFLTGEGTLW